MDIIKIKKLEVFAKHGVFKEENFLGQKFLISVEMHVNTRNAGLSDDLSKSVNYGEACLFIKSIMENNTYMLIETAAEKISHELLLEFPLIEKVRIEIEKPWAPVNLPLETVSVEIERGWHKVFLSIGSNMGNEKEYLDFAVEKIGEDNDNRVIKVSNYIVTKPVGYEEQNDFLNSCIEIDTLKNPEELLKAINKIEAEAKRERKIHWGPRTLDIDIITYDQEIINTDSLVIPHREMCNRLFVLEPLKEICPNFIHPVEKCSISKLIENLISKPH